MQLINQSIISKNQVQVHRVHQSFIKVRKVQKYFYNEKSTVLEKQYRFRNPVNESQNVSERKLRAL
jgi:hypothetical protein